MGDGAETHPAGTATADSTQYAAISGDPEPLDTLETESKIDQNIVGPSEHILNQESRSPRN